MLGGLNSQNQRLQDQANAQALMDELKESKQRKPRKGVSDMNFMQNWNSIQVSRRTSTTGRDT